MKRFENAEVGDRVYDEILGDGYIQSFDIKQQGSVLVTLGSGSGPNMLYDSDGNLFEMRGVQIKPSLFYLDANGNKCTERPEQPIDWEKVEPGDRFEVRLNEEDEWEIREFMFFVKGEPWFLSDKDDTVCFKWNYIRRIK